MANNEIGFVYILKNEAMPGIYKIGITSRDDLDKRISELYNGQTSVPLPFECVFACKVERYKDVEKIIHNAFSDTRINPNREFFTVSPERVIPLLKHLQIEESTENIKDKIDAMTPAVDKESNKKFGNRRPNFNFVEMGINIGETIVFSDENNPVEAVVISERQVKYAGIEYAMTKLTSELLNVTYGVPPMLYWKYKGKLLREYYNETYGEM